MKRIKELLLILMAAVTVSFSSCTNLDEIVYSDLTSENLTGSEEEIVTLLGNLYVQLRYNHWAWEGYFDIMEESSDLLMTPYRTYGGWGAQYINLHQHDFYAGIPHLYQEWYYCYNGISKANSLLENEIVLANEKMTAEIRAIRVMYYYIIFDLWRNIPLETKISTDPSYQPTQVAPEYIWDFMTSELEEIIPVLTTEKKYGRMNKYAACMLASKIYLNHDAWLRGFGMDASGTMVPASVERNASSEWFQTNADNDNKWYKKAYDYADLVCDEGGYTLSENYLDNSRATLIGNTEAIFVLPEDGAKATHNYLVNKCFVGNGGKAYGYSGTPWNGSCAVPQFVRSYDEDDTRLTDTWAFGQQYYYQTEDPIYMADQKRVSDGDPDALKASDLSTALPSGKTHADYAHVAGDFPLVYTVEVHSINAPGAYDVEGARFQKQEVVAGTVGTYGNDVCFFRLSDAYFIKAEVLLRIGSYNGENEQTAANLITEVRQRAFRDTDPSKATRTVADLKGDSVYDYGVRECTTNDSKNPYADFKYADANDLRSALDSSYDKDSFTRNNDTKIELGGLLDDLAWEFVGEHHRRQDLIRFTLDNGVTVYSGKQWFCHKTMMTSQTQPTDYKHNVFPIYSNFCKSNIKLVQNWGYTDDAATDQPAG